MPRSAAAFVPAMMAAGVAKPIAHGQAMMSTAAQWMMAAASALAGMEMGQRNFASAVEVAAAELKCESPPQGRGKRDENDDGNEHAAHAIAEALDVGAAVLRAFDGGDDLRERRGLTSRGHLHRQHAIHIHSAAVNDSAGRFIHGNGFAREHGLVNSGFALEDFAIGRHTLARSQHDDVADAQLRNRHHFFNAGSWSERRACAGARASNFFIEPAARAVMRDSIQCPTLMRVMMAAASMK